MGGYLPFLSRSVDEHRARYGTRLAQIVVRAGYTLTSTGIMCASGQTSKRRNFGMYLLKIDLHFLGDYHGQGRIHPLAAFLFCHKNGNGTVFFDSYIGVGLKIRTIIRQFLCCLHPICGINTQHKSASGESAQLNKPATRNRHFFHKKGYNLWSGVICCSFQWPVVPLVGYDGRYHSDTIRHPSPTESPPQKAFYLLLKVRQGSSFARIGNTRIGVH